jgi:hypothetical protein
MRAYALRLKLKRRRRGGGRVKVSHSSGVRIVPVAVGVLVATGWLGLGCGKRAPVPGQAPAVEGTNGVAAPAAPRDAFGKVDRDGDGKLSMREYCVMFRDKAIGERNFKKADQDGDGFISRGEFPKSSTGF